MRENILRAGSRILPLVLAGAMTASAASAPTNADNQQELQVALDHYASMKSADQRVAVLEYLQHLDHKVVAEAIIDHIIAAPSGMDATEFNRLIEPFNPEACTAVIDRLGKTTAPIPKGKLIVALRHCENTEAIHALSACLDDKHPVPFESHTATPRRVCDLAYDELYLKLRHDPRYHLDSSANMKGVIGEKTPVKTRDAEISKLKNNLLTPKAAAPPVTAPTVPPEVTKPATASVSV